MKSLGVEQLLKKKFKLLDIPAEWLGLLGMLPKFFIMTIVGYSGNGKTELAVRFAKMLTRFGKVAWLSYEQGHGVDLQRACVRNAMHEVKGKFIPIDPLEDMAEGSTYFSELVAYCLKKTSAPFIFIDSIDYLKLTTAEFKYLKEKFPNKTFIFIGHGTSTGKPKEEATRIAMFYGQATIVVKDYIAFPEKSRFGGTEPLIIWEQEARKRMPKFFN